VKGKRASPKAGHGGARPGAGRKPSENPRKPYSLRLTDEERKALDALGGPEFFLHHLHRAMKKSAQ
jgi:hypothetical protein